MKFVGVSVFLIALKWTWSLALCEPVVDARTHVQVQQELRGIISQVISQLRPSATHLKFNSIWTEDLGDNILRAHFNYSFKDQDESGEEVMQTEEGFGTLNRIKDERNSDTNAWSLDEVTVSQEVIDFKKGVVIAPKGE
ncbi:MAG: hypothetical protein A4S09_01430 [Proteobacteria bacterium SG_bin7]|nr:MAG: hypothetical protein A4S09_01430 [Proteobacteria bacterium SG_bin7]